MKKDLMIFVLIVVIATAFYAALPVIYPPQGSIIDDSVEYALQAESTDPDRWFHPHHLLYNIIHRMGWIMLGGEKSPLRVIYIMRWTSHLCMGMVLAILFILAQRMGASRIRAILISLLLMVACSFWVFGSVAEVVAPSTALVFGVIWGLFYRRDGTEPPLYNIIILGLLLGLAVTINQIVIIFLPAFWLGMLGWCKGNRLKPIIFFSLSCIIWAFVAYLLVIVLVLHVYDLSRAYQFLTTYAHWNIWGRGTFASLGDSFNTLLLTQSYSYFGQQNRTFLFNLAIAMPVLLTMGGFWGWTRGKAGSNWKSAWGWAALFGLISFGFITWWAAAAWDYWLVLWGIIILGWAKPDHEHHRLINLTLICSIVITGAYNLVYLQQPRNSDEKNPYYRAGQFLSHLSTNNRVLLISMDYHLMAYSCYWGGVKEVHLHNLYEKDKNYVNAKRDIEETVLSNLYYGDSANGIIIDEIVYKTLSKSFTQQPQLGKWFEERCISLFESAQSTPPVNLFLIKSRQDWENGTM